MRLTTRLGNASSSAGLRVVALMPQYRSHRRRFLAIAARLHRGEPLYVPPLRRELDQVLDPSRNPWFRHAEMALFVAERGKEEVGRVAAIVDRKHNEFHAEAAGFFGFFDSIDDADCAAMLLAEVERWATTRGATVIRGPVSPSTNDECGLLVDGFETRPAILTAQNPPYYAALVEACGYHKERDLLAYDFSADQEVRPAIVRISGRLEESGEFRLREIDLRRFESEIEVSRGIYNAAWERNWGFVPLDVDEFHWKARHLRSLIDPRFALFVEVRSGASFEPVAFGLAIPDLNEVLARLNGRLTPLAVLKLLWGMRRLSSLRLLMLGVVQRFRRHGVEALLIRELHLRAARAGYRRAELSWILEDNVLMNHSIVRAGGRVYKRYRIYGKHVA